MNVYAIETAGRKILAQFVFAGTARDEAALIASQKPRDASVRKAK